MAPNLDRHPLHKGQYIAYDAGGFAFRVDRALPSGWRARPSHAAQSQDYRIFYAPTLDRIAARVGASKARD
jgi:hypothetical protein